MLFELSIVSFLEAGILAPCLQKHTQTHTQSRSLQLPTFSKCVCVCVGVCARTEDYRDFGLWQLLLHALCL